MRSQKSKPKEPKTTGKVPAGDKRASLTSLGEVQVKYEPAPAKAPEGKKIHPRRPLPLVREAPARQDEEEGAPKKTSSEQT